MYEDIEVAKAVAEVLDFYKHEKVNLVHNFYVSIHQVFSVYQDDEGHFTLFLVEDDGIAQLSEKESLAANLTELQNLITNILSK